MGTVAYVEDPDPFWDWIWVEKQTPPKNRVRSCCPKFQRRT